MAFLPSFRHGVHGQSSNWDWPLEVAHRWYDCGTTDAIVAIAGKRTTVPRDCRELLIDLREGAAMWLGLRKHLSVEDTELVLRILQEHSRWREVKRSEDKKLRREYLRLFYECKHFDPQWEHAEMKRRTRRRHNKCNVGPNAAIDVWLWRKYLFWPFQTSWNPRFLTCVFSDRVSGQIRCRYFLTEETLVCFFLA